MVDTLVLRIHNLDKYPLIYEQFYNPSNNKNSFTQAMVDEKTGELVETVFRPAIIFHDTNRILHPNFRSHLNIASSHYHLAYSVNTQKNYAEFNFSIPKYLYSTNVMQFINQASQDADTTFNKLVLFIYKFLNENFIKPPLYEDVEINRIDLCYNQFFVTKEDALAYLDEQKKLLVKFARSSKNNFRSYDTSLMYITKRYSFKIYHKGTEFEKNDYKELLKDNPLKLPLGYFKQESDRILRYEMTFRSSYLSYLMQHYFFISEKKAMYEQYANHKVTRTFKQMIGIGFRKVYENYKRTSKYFTLKSIFDNFNTRELLTVLMEHNSEKARLQRTDFKFEDTITYDKTIFQICYNTFWDKVKQYQLTQVMDITQINDKITAYQEMIKKRRKTTTKSLKNSHENRNLDKTKALLIAVLVNQKYNIDELKKYIPESTFKLLKKQLKEIGITSNHTNLSIVLPKLDYQEYRIYFQKFHKD